MDLEVARKSLSKRSAFSKKKIAFVATAGLVLVAGIAMRASHYFGEAPAGDESAGVEASAPAPATAPASAPEAAPPPPAETTESIRETPPDTQQSAPAPSEPAEQADDAAEQTEPEANAVEPNEQAEFLGSGMILVSRKPVEVLASPSASAPAMFGFPSGRPFRVIGREGGFVHIKDLKSSASGWIDEAALAAPPPSAPAVAAPSQSKPGTVRKPATASADPKPKIAKKGAPAVADSEPVAEPEPSQPPRRPGLFGRGGLFGGIFSNGN